MNEITQRQREILKYIHEAVSTRGFPPTIREIGAEFGIRSTNGVNDHLKALERKGFLRRGDKQSRALSATQEGLEILGIDLSAPPSEGPYAPRVDRLIEVPVLGRVAAGEPILAFEEATDTVQVDSFLLGGTSTRVFALRIVGESMIEDGIHDGDYIFVKKQLTASKGDIVVAMIEGEATVKRFYPEGDRIRFQPANAAMSPIYVYRDQFRATQLIGLVVGVYRRLN